MKRFAWILAAIPSFFWLSGACGGNDSGLFGKGGAGGAGAQCKPGGQACAAFSECCSGTCASSVCTFCSQEGASCTNGCCSGLTCQNGTCGKPCGDVGTTCTFSTDCCSKVCSQGKCGACGKEGGACVLSGDCCSQICSQGKCGPTCAASGAACTLASDCCSQICSQGKCAAPSCQPAGGTCNGTSFCCQGLACQAGTCQIASTCSGSLTCASWWNDASLSYMQLSCAAQPYADSIISCLCTNCAGACVDESTCTQQWHDNTPLGTGCHDCVYALEQSTCLGFVQACQSH